MVREGPKENQDISKNPGETKTSTEDLFGFLEWYEDSAASPKEKRLLKQSINAALDERSDLVEKEFEKMVAEDPDLRAAFESLPREMTATDARIDEEELMGELQKSSEQFEWYVQWFDDFAHTADKKNLSPDNETDFAAIKRALYFIGRAQQTGFGKTKDVVIAKFSCIRKMKDFLRKNGATEDMLTKEAFQKWLKSKKMKQEGDGSY